MLTRDEALDIVRDALIAEGIAPEAARVLAESVIHALRDEELI
jgi:hypothetical protein